MEGSQAFIALLDRGLTAPVSLASWCPTMDLVALATADGQLYLHRLNWQRLWWTSPEAPVTALAWRPDGKQLAVGLGDGRLLLLDAEDGEVQRQEQLLGAAVTALCWAGLSSPPAAENAATEERGGNSSNAAATAEDRARRLFSPLPDAPAAAPAALGYARLGMRGSEHWPQQPSGLEVLACGSAAGELLLCTSALFRLAALSLSQLAGTPQPGPILRLAAAPSLRQLTVCWEDSSSGALQVGTLSLAHIGANAPRLHRVGLLAGDVAALASACGATLVSLVQEWERGMQEFADAKAKLRASLQDFGEDGDPEEQLLQLLTVGAVGGAMQHYLTTALGEAGLKRAARAADSAACAVHTLLADQLQPALEQLAFRLGELRGLALCRPWAQVAGLDAREVEAAEQAAVQLVLAAEHLRMEVVQAGACHRMFFTWLLSVMRRVQEDSHDTLVHYPRTHIDAVATFLRQGYAHDSIAPLLQHGGPATAGQPPSSVPGATAAAGVSSGSSSLDLVLEVLGRQALAEAGDSAAGDAQPPSSSSSSGGTSSLASMFAGLQGSCNVALGHTSSSISPTVTLVQQFALGPSPSALALSYQQNGLATLCASWASQQHILLLRSASSGSSSWEGALLALPGGCTAVDVAFYKEGQLALALAEEDACSLDMVLHDSLPCVQLDKGLLAESDALQLTQLLADSVGGPLDLPQERRHRQLPYGTAAGGLQQPLAVSATRGIGCVLAGTQRVLLYDLEEDEEGEEGLEEEEGGEELADS